MKESLKLNMKFSNYIFIAVFFLMVTLFSLLAISFQNIQNNEQKAEILNTATYYSYDLKTYLDRALSASYAVAALLSQNDGVIKNFESVSEDILPFYPGVIELAISPQGIINK